jgi:hypothetical protein
MADDLVKRMADIERRLRGLKAERRVDFSQLQLFTQSWDFSLTLPGSGTTDYLVTIECAGDPIADVAADGFPLGVNNTIKYAGYFFSVSGNTMYADIWLVNQKVTSETVPLHISAWALNGISATCVRV